MLPPTTLQIEQAAATPGAVSTDASLQRVLAIPRRVALTEDEIDLLSAAFRTRTHDDEGEPNRLLRPQAEALREIYDTHGLAGHMGVGSGKTLVTMLAPTMLKSVRPVLMVPASMRGKTRRDFAGYARNWRVRLPELLSYQEMGRHDRHDRLAELAPDLLMLDECDMARSDESAVSKRIERWRDTDTGKLAIMVCVSGTFMTGKLIDSFQLTKWSLGDGAPMPTRRAEAERWAQSLDTDLGRRPRTGMGALQAIPGGYHKHFRESRGVLTSATSDCNAQIVMSMWEPPLPPVLSDMIESVGASKMRPDGVPLGPFDLPECLSQLALGFYQIWDPLPPKWWLSPRSAWYTYLQAVLDERHPAFDTPFQIIRALDTYAHAPQPATPSAPEEGRALLAAWRAVRDHFVPNPIPTWIDDTPLQQIAARALDPQRKGTLVWVRNIPAGNRLQKMGLPYYCAGTDPEQAPPGQSIALSFKAFHRGCNLQAWHRMLYTSTPADATLWEQSIGREHRHKQKADRIFVDVLGTLDYHHSVMARVQAQALKISTEADIPQKLTLADWTTT